MPPNPPRGREALLKKYVVARAADIADGERLIVDVAGRSVGIFNVGGAFYAFLNRCPHGGAPLCRGDVVSRLVSDRPGHFELKDDQKFLVCPWHGWEFDIASGESFFDPQRMRARPFHIDVETGDLVAEDLAQGQAVEPGADVAQFVDPATHRIKGPYRAPIVPVDIEGEYIVLTLRRQVPKRAPAPSQQRSEHV